MSILNSILDLFYAVDDFWKWLEHHASRPRLQHYFPITHQHELIAPSGKVD
jgi:hypothetical protein